MNAKEQIIDLLKEQLLQFKMQMPYKRGKIELLNKLITATEAAIFDLPSEEDIQERALKYSTGCYVDYVSGCNFILNYKKSEL